MFGSTEQDDAEKTPHPGPLPRWEREEEVEDVDLDRVSVREIERATGMRRTHAGKEDGRPGVAGTQKTVSSPLSRDRAGDGSAPGFDDTHAQDTPAVPGGGGQAGLAPGREEEFSRGDLGEPKTPHLGPPPPAVLPGGEREADRRLEASATAALTGEQIEMAGLYELAGRARRAAGVVMGLTDSELIDRLGSMGIDEIESVVDVLESLSRSPEAGSLRHWDSHSDR